MTKSKLMTNWHRFKPLQHSTVLPYAFYEHGVAMLASVLRNKTAVKISINIIKVFVKLRKILSTHKELSDKFSQVERKIEKHDKEIHTIYQAIRELMKPPEKTKREIGFGRE